MKTILLVLLLSVQSFADIDVYDYSGSKVGRFKAIECPANVQCSQIGNGWRVRLRQDSNQIDVTASDYELSVTECGSTVINSAAGFATLPEASTALGCEFKFIVGHTGGLTIDPADATDQIVLLTNSGGDELVADAVGESVVLQAIGNDSWAPVGSEKGTWTDSD